LEYNIYEILKTPDDNTINLQLEHNETRDIKIEFFYIIDNLFVIIGL